jgi:hypothetical protein
MKLIDGVDFLDGLLDELKDTVQGKYDMDAGYTYSDRYDKNKPITIGDLIEIMENVKEQLLDRQRWG